MVKRSKTYLKAYLKSSTLIQFKSKRNNPWNKIRALLFICSPGVVSTQNGNQEHITINPVGKYACKKASTITSNVSAWNSISFRRLKMHSVPDRRNFEIFSEMSDAQHTGTSPQQSPFHKFHTEQVQRLEIGFLLTSNKTLHFQILQHFCHEQSFQISNDSVGHPVDLSGNPNHTQLCSERICAVILCHQS